jgi:hypothetical protein
MLTSNSNTNCATTPTSSSYLANLEDQFCKDFFCCGFRLGNLHDLLQHFEEYHVRVESDFEDSDEYDDDEFSSRFGSGASHGSGSGNDASFESGLLGWEDELMMGGLGISGLGNVDDMLPFDLEDLENMDISGVGGEGLGLKSISMQRQMDMIGLEDFGGTQASSNRDPSQPFSKEDMEFLRTQLTASLQTMNSPSAKKDGNDQQTQQEQQHQQQQQQSQTHSELNGIIRSSPPPAVESVNVSDIFSSTATITATTTSNNAVAPSAFGTSVIRKRHNSAPSHTLQNQSSLDATPTIMTASPHSIFGSGPLDRNSASGIRRNNSTSSASRRNRMNKSGNTSSSTTTGSSASSLLNPKPVKAKKMGMGVLTNPLGVLDEHVHIGPVIPFCVDTSVPTEIVVLDSSSSEDEEDEEVNLRKLGKKNYRKKKSEAEAAAAAAASAAVKREEQDEDGMVDVDNDYNAALEQEDEDGGVKRDGGDEDDMMMAMDVHFSPEARKNLEEARILAKEEMLEIMHINTNATAAQLGRSASAHPLQQHQGARNHQQRPNSVSSNIGPIKRIVSPYVPGSNANTTASTSSSSAAAAPLVVATSRVKRELPEEFDEDMDMDGHTMGMADNSNNEDDEIIDIMSPDSPSATSKLAHSNKHHQNQQQQHHLINRSSSAMSNSRAASPFHNLAVAGNTISRSNSRNSVKRLKSRSASPSTATAEASSVMMMMDVVEEVLSPVNIVSPQPRVLGGSASVAPGSAGGVSSRKARGKSPSPGASGATASTAAAAAAAVVGAPAGGVVTGKSNTNRRGSNASIAGAFASITSGLITPTASPAPMMMASSAAAAKKRRGSQSSQTSSTSSTSPSVALNAPPSPAHSAKGSNSSSSDEPSAVSSPSSKQDKETTPTPTTTTSTSSSAEKSEKSEKKSKTKNKDKGEKEIEKEDAASKDPKPFKCPYEACEKMYKNPGGLKYHLQHSHPDSPQLYPHLLSASALSAANVTLNGEGGDELDTILSKPYECTVPECGKRYKNLNGLKYHIEHSHAELLGGCSTASGLGSEGMEEKEGKEEEKI